MSTSDSVAEIINSCLALRTRLVSRSISSIYEEAMADHGVTIAQVNMLTAMALLGPCAPSKIGEVIQLERSTVSRSLDLLMKKKLVEAVSSDAKGVREVGLTAAGREKVDAVLPDWRAAQAKASRLLGTAGVKAVHEAAASVWTSPI